VEGQFSRQLPCGAFLISSLKIAAVHSAALDAICISPRPVRLSELF